MKWLIGCGCLLAVLALLVVLAAGGIFGYFYMKENARPVLTSSPAGETPVAAAEQAVDDGAFAFMRNDKVYVVIRAGEKPRSVGTGGFPALSPDRRHVAYASTATSRTTYQLVELKTGQARTIMDVDGGPREPGAWSPDGKRLALIVDDGNDRYRVVVWSLETGEAKTIFSEGGENYGMLFNLCWNPDGRSVLFHNMRLWIEVGLNGGVLKTSALETITGSQENITSSDVFVLSPTNPDRLVMTHLVEPSERMRQSNGEPNTAIFIHDLSSGTSTRLTPVDMVAFAPVWARDGRSILFCGYPDRFIAEDLPFRIYRVNVDGSGMKELARGEAPST